MKPYTTDQDFDVVRLRLELTEEQMSREARKYLKRYGECCRGDAITRDIFIPTDMPLHALHYAIQRLFGWQNSHLRAFLLPEEIYAHLTGNTVKGWAELVGTLFQPPSEYLEDIFWDDDYKTGSIKAWLRKKYTGPYRYQGVLEHPLVAQEDVKQLLDHYAMVSVRESFAQFHKRSQQTGEKKLKILKKAPLAELTLQEMYASIALENGADKLLERLRVDEVLAFEEEELGEELFPVTRKLIYNYDFGDNWEVAITKRRDIQDLLEEDRVSIGEVDEAIEAVITHHRPVCLSKEGLSLTDDLGGLEGYADFLYAIYESESSEQRSQMKEWGKSMGWSDKKIPPQKML